MMNIYFFYNGINKKSCPCDHVPHRLNSSQVNKLLVKQINYEGNYWKLKLLNYQLKFLITVIHGNMLWYIRIKYTQWIQNKNRLSDLAKTCYRFQMKNVDTVNEPVFCELIYE